MTAAIIKLDALADPVGAAAEDDRFFPIGRMRFAIGCVRAKCSVFIGGIKIRCLGCKLRRARVDPLIYRAHAERMPQTAHPAFGVADELAKARIRKSHALKLSHFKCGLGQAVAADRCFCFNDARYLTQEPQVDTCDAVDLLDREAHSQGLSHDAQPVGRLNCQRCAHLAF